jgi:cation diffusion facilitator CzcD-associated flavoprotein CzcO
MNTKYTAVIIGSGFSGLCMAIKLKEKGIDDFIILEKAESLGGTWRENTYPGAECDIPSALYSYSFEPYPYWEYKWSHQPQILDYLKYCAQKYQLYPHLQFGKSLLSATWQEEGQYWELRTHDQEVIHTQCFISAVGQLHYPSTPSFKGVENFQPPSFHSAEWRHDVSLKDKRVAVIGNAASALQFVPEIAKEAKEVTVFQRTPNWVLPKQDRLYKNWEKRLVERFPSLLRVYRLRLWLLSGALFIMLKKEGAWLRGIYQWLSKRYLKRHIDDPELRQKLTPDYPLGAKRVLFSDNYFKALNKDHVKLITSPIERLTATAVQTKDNQQHEADVLINATGFKSNPLLMGLDVKGQNQQTIQEVWAEEAVNYLGIAVADFPNLFLMFGPNTNLGHSSIILMAEAQANYIAQCVAAMQQNNWQTMRVKPSAQANYYQEIQRRLKNMIWEEVANSWYKSANGSNPNNWPGRTMEYMRRTRRPRFEDYEVGY